MANCAPGLVFWKEELFAKVAVGVVAVLLAVIAAIIPFLLQACNMKRAIGFGNSFAAGMFLAVGLLHMLPEAERKMRAVYGDEFADRFHPGFLLCLLGYAATLTIQRVAIEVPMHDHHHETVEAPRTCRHAHSDTPSEHKSIPLPLFVTDLSAAKRTYGTMRSWHASHGHADHSHGASEGQHGAAGPPHSGYIATRNRVLLLSLVLSLHSAVEGMAVGVQCRLPGVLFLGVAVLGHKWAEAFALGSSLAAMQCAFSTELGDALEVGLASPRTPGGTAQIFSPRRQHTFRLFLGSQLVLDRLCVLVILVFALSNPLGIALGFATMRLLPPLASACVVAVSSGTFLYIGASEVVVEEFKQGQRYWGKWAFFMAGIGGVYLLFVL